MQIGSMDSNLQGNGKLITDTEGYFVSRRRKSLAAANDKNTQSQSGYRQRLRSGLNAIAKLVALRIVTNPPYQEV